MSEPQQFGLMHIWCLRANGSNDFSFEFAPMNSVMQPSVANDCFFQLAHNFIQQEVQIRFN